MHIVLLSGGSGKRLWPLSNEIRSKQFIPIFRQEDGTYLSMAQRVYRQVLRADAGAEIVIATSRGQVATLRHQLGEAVELSVEPCRRDTFPAIALAGAYLHDKKGVGEEEAIAICPVDPYVEDGYFAAVRELTELAAKGEASLLLMGVEPTYPSAKYGYILPRDKGRISGVEAFREKPEESEAARYIRQGALWNSGVLPAVSAMCWKKHARRWAFLRMRRFWRAMRRYGRSASITRWWKRKAAFPSCVTAESGRIWGRGTR